MITPSVFEFDAAIIIERLRGKTFDKVEKKKKSNDVVGALNNGISHLLYYIVAETVRYELFSTSTTTDVNNNVEVALTRLLLSRRFSTVTRL